MKYNDAIKQLQAKQLKSVYLITGEELYLDAYLAGFESGLGVPDGLANHTKVASQFLGRELMGEFVAKALLNK